MKYIKTFEDLVSTNPTKLNNEIKYGEVGNFYHATIPEYIELLKKGIDPKNSKSSNDSKSQGGGFYVWNSIEKLKNWKGRSEKSNIIVQIQAKLIIENFEIDYELHGLSFDFFWTTLINIISKHKYLIYVSDYGYNDNDDNILLDLKKINNNSNLTDYVKKEYSEKKRFPYIIITNENLTKNDVWLEEQEGSSMDSIIKSSKNVGWIQPIPFGGGDQKAIYQMIESLKKFGIKDEFKKAVINRCSALKYVGQKIFPVKFIKLK